jgi:hypothetical protein
MGELRNVYKILIGKPEGKRQLARLRRRWKDNIKGIEWKGVDRIHLAQIIDQWLCLVNRVMNIRLR